MKNFVSNYIVSFLGYIAVCLLEIAIQPLVEYQGVIYDAVIGKSEILQNFAVAAIFACTMVIPFVLYFFLGTRLKLFRNRWIDYLSVTSSVIIILIVALLTNADFNNSRLIWGANSSYGMFMVILIVNLVNSGVIGSIILAVIPSLNIWLGMLWRARRKRRSN